MGDGSMSEAVKVALADTTQEPKDAAARALVVQYAALIDEAAPKGTYDQALKVLAAVAKNHGGPRVEKAFQTVADALAAHTVASDLGPKLLATLLALGMAPAGRNKAEGGGGPVVPVASKLDELRARRDARQNGA